MEPCECKQKILAPDDFIAVFNSGIKLVRYPLKLSTICFSLPIPYQRYLKSLLHDFVVS